MDRRQFLALASSAAFLPGFTRYTCAHAADDTAFRTLRGNVGSFTGQGGTIGWLVADDAVVVIDSQFPETATQLWKGLEAREVRKIDYLINTHHHYDHTSGNPTLKPHATHILAHKNVPGLQQKFNAQRGEVVVADETFETEWTKKIGGETIRLNYYGPAHTGGDAVIHLENTNVVHVGDLMFNRIPPYIDRPSGASIRNWVTVLEKIHGVHDNDAIFIFGHGDSTDSVIGTRADLLVFRDFLTHLLEYTQAGIDAGKTVDQIASVDRLPNFPQFYSEQRKDGIPTDIRIAYEELTSK